MSCLITAVLEMTECFRSTQERVRSACCYKQTTYSCAGSEVAQEPDHHEGGVDAGEGVQRPGVDALLAQVPHDKLSRIVHRHIVLGHIFNKVCHVLFRYILNSIIIA